MVHEYNLHIVVALEEVGDSPLAEFGVTQLAGGGRPAKHELSALFRAVLRTLIRIEQLLDTISGFRDIKGTYVEAVSTPYIF